MVHSLAVYDLVVDALHGRQTSARRRQVAFEAPVATWERVLTFEGCAERSDRAFALTGLHSEAPKGVRRLLRDATATALRQAALAQKGLAEIAVLASARGVRVLALKGAARLLAGELPGTRSMSDIDLLIEPAEAERFHALVRNELGYHSSGQAYAHHLPALTRPGSLGIEIHRQLTDTPLVLDRAIFRDTRRVILEGSTIEVPSPASMVLHTLEHAARLNWMVHYRLRDVLDIASLFTSDVSREVIRSYTHASSRRTAFETLLSAAHSLEPSAPRDRRQAWRTVRRVARARLALAAVPHGRTAANRVFRYASVVAEGSPRMMLRAGVSLLRRVGASVLPAAAFILAGCSETTRPQPLTVPSFIFVSDSGGTPGLFLFDEGDVTRLSAVDQEDVQPHSAAGRIVFVSRRDGNSEIYIGNLDLANQQRLTNHAATDVDPALDPTGTTVAFVSSRSGAPRIWLMDVTGENLRALDTGSQTFTPEGSPAWSPSGDRIAFTSTRTNTSQVFVIDTTTGQAEQLSHETGGAFSPTWSADGGGVLYVLVVGEPRVMRAPTSGDEPTVFASGDRMFGDPTCVAELCLAVGGADTGDGDILAVAADRAAQEVLVRAANDRQPAFLVP